MTERFATMCLDQASQVTAPDGSTVRPLCALPGVASFAQFALAPGQTAKAVFHATVEEIWYVISGMGEIWRSQDGREEVTVLEPGVCLTIPLGTKFQFRAGAQELRVVAVTVPPWPVNSPNEARLETGRW
jgi:mannose-6-phosphate isomerase-like protein (cupin superfamily)